jgi:lysozyme family protein
MRRIGRGIRGFAAFWWDFIVGDDWRIAAGVVVALAGTALIQTTDVPSWWLLPVAVVAVLGLSLWDAARKAKRAG